MKTWIIGLMAAAIAFTGCAPMVSSRIDTSSKTNVTLMQYKKMAVIKFQNPKNDMAGQEAADILALGFLKQGFNVVGSSQLAGLIDQNEVYSSGLTPEIKSRLKTSGIDSVVVGTVNEYVCSRSDKGPLALKTDEPNHCSVTVTARMLALDTGEIVWGAAASDARDGRWVTAESVLRSIVQKMQTTIPDIIALRSVTDPPIAGGSPRPGPQPRPEPRPAK